MDSTPILDALLHAQWRFTKMVKVMHFIHGLSTGGAEILVKDYMLNFNKQKLDVVLLCLRHRSESPYEDILKKNGAKVIYVDDYSPFSGHTGFINKALNHICRFFIIKRIIKEESPDIIHSHLYVNHYLKFARPKRDTTLCYTLHNEPEKVWSKDNKGKMKDYSAIKYLNNRYGVHFIALHESMAEEIREIFNTDNVSVFNNGIDIERFRSKKDSDKLRSELSIPKEAFVVGHIGRFAVQKNQAFLLDIFRIINKQNKNAFLMMVGSGEDKDIIVSRIKEYNLNDKCLILSNRSDIPSLLSTMDVFVFPSKYEGLGIVLIEGQEAKLPCFISDKVPSHAIISNLVTVLPLDVGAEKWAETILSYRKPKKTVLNDKDWDIKIVTKKLEQYYLSIITEKQNGKK